MIWKSWLECGISYGNSPLTQVLVRWTGYCGTRYQFWWRSWWCFSSISQLLSCSLCSLCISGKHDLKALLYCHQWSVWWYSCCPTFPTLSSARLYPSSWNWSRRLPLQDEKKKRQEKTKLRTNIVRCLWGQNIIFPKGHKHFLKKIFAYLLKFEMKY